MTGWLSCFRALFPSGLTVFGQELMDADKEGRREKAPIRNQDEKLSE